MCPQLASQLFRCGHMVEVDTGRTARFCLLGEQCGAVGYAQKIFRRIDRECPSCEQRLGAAGNRYWPAARKPYYAQDKMRVVEGAPARLREILAEDSFTAKNGKDLLYYIVGLPFWMRKDRLVSEFGYGTAGRFGQAWEKEMIGIAAKKPMVLGQNPDSKYLSEPLVLGMTKKENESKK